MQLNIVKCELHNISIQDIPIGEVFILDHKYYLRVVVDNNNKDSTMHLINGDGDGIFPLKKNRNGIIDSVFDYLPCIKLDGVVLWGIDSRIICEQVQSTLTITEA